MTVRKNIAFGLEIRKRFCKDEICARVDELLALVHLGGWRVRAPALRVSREGRLCRAREHRARGGPGAGASPEHVAALTADPRARAKR
jgi:hypothetical protein